MKGLCYLLLAAAAAHSVNGDIVGSIQIPGADPETLYVWRQFGSVTVENNAVTLYNDSRAYLVTTQDVLTLTGEEYYQMPLSGRTFSYDVDLSRVACHCNAALYWNKMPANGPSDGLDYYCDANYVGGIGCPEFDGLESNKHTVLTTLHRCDWDGSWWTNCDGGGCGANSWDVDQNAVGQGKRIDTASEFRISHFQNSGQATITLDQNGETFSWNDCNDGGYVSTMDDYWQDGMVIVFSLWGSQDNNDMWWMDDKTGCQPEGGFVGCDIENAYATWSNFNLA